MTTRRWVVWWGAASAAIFAVALGIKVMPEIALVGVGSTAPDFHAIDLATGRPLSLSDYRGKVLLINIWATYCGPCRAEMPSIERLHRLVPDSAFRIVSVSVDKVDSSTVTAFARAYQLTFPILQNKSGDIEDAYQTTGVPESFVVDRNGIIVKKVISAAEWDGPVNVELIRSLIDEH